jgi:hypothetical protein
MTDIRRECMRQPHALKSVKGSASVLRTLETVKVTVEHKFERPLKPKSYILFQSGNTKQSIIIRRPKKVRRNIL